MEVGKPLEKLVDEGADGGHFESAGGLLQNFQQIVFDILEDEIDNALLAEGLLEFDDVGMGGQLEYFDLSHGGFLGVLFFVRLLEFLDSHMHFGLDVPTFQHDPVGPLPNR